MLRTTALTLALLALAPAAAGAATLTVDGASTIHYTAADGEANRVSMRTIDVGYGLVKDDGVPNLTGCGTIWSEPGWLACPNARRPQIALGDQDDTTWIIDGGSEPGEWIGAARVDGRSGDDELRATTGADDVLLGGLGNDKLHAQFGANRLEGGEGDDTLRSGFSDDTKIGGPGADTFLGHDGNETIDAADGAGTDTIGCGEGTDTVTADWNDTVGAGCESVTRVGVPPKDERPAEEQARDQAPGDQQPGDDRTRSLRANVAARIVVRGPVRRLRLVARDAAGNETVRRVRA